MVRVMFVGLTHNNKCKTGMLQCIKSDTPIILSEFVVTKRNPFTMIGGHWQEKYLYYSRLYNLFYLALDAKQC